MFEIYVVIIADGQKYRHDLGVEEDYELACKRAREAASFYAEYACIRDTRQGTIQFISRPQGGAGRACTGQVLPRPGRLH